MDFIIWYTNIGSFLISNLNDWNLKVTILISIIISGLEKVFAETPKWSLIGCVACRFLLIL